MEFKRIKCFLTGGCKFKGGTSQVQLDKKDNVTITETCYKCGKQYSFTVPYSAFGEYVDIRLKGKTNASNR